MSGSTKAQPSTKTFKSKTDQVFSFEPNKNAQDVDAFPAETSTVTLPTESSSMEPSIDPSVRILPILTLLMDAIFHHLKKKYVYLCTYIYNAVKHIKKHIVNNGILCHAIWLSQISESSTL